MQQPLRERIVGQLPRRWSAADANGARRWSVPAGLAVTLLGFAVAFGAYVIVDDERDTAPAQVARHAQEPHAQEPNALARHALARHEADSDRGRTPPAREPPPSELSSLSAQTMLALIQAQIDSVRAENAEDAARASRHGHGRAARITENGERAASASPPSSDPGAAETRRKSARTAAQAGTRRHGPRAGTFASAVVEAGPAPSASVATAPPPGEPDPSPLAAAPGLPGAGASSPAVSPIHGSSDAPRDGPAAPAAKPAPPLLATPTGAESSRQPPAPAPPSPACGDADPVACRHSASSQNTPGEAMPSGAPPSGATPGESKPGEPSASDKPNLVWNGAVQPARAAPARKMARVSTPPSHKPRRGAKPRMAERAATVAARERPAAVPVAPKPVLAWPFEIPAEPHRRPLDLTQAQSALYRGH